MFLSQLLQLNLLTYLVVTDYSKHMDFETDVKDKQQTWGTIANFITNKAKAPYNHVITRLKTNELSNSISVSLSK